MPPRYAYWTIIVDDQPTAFRAGALDDIMPTFNRLKEKQPTAKLMWFQSGKLWPSRIDAREAMQVRGERGRYSDPRQDGGDKPPSRERPKWKSKDFSSPKPQAPSRERSERPEWKPRSSSPKPQASSRGRSDRPEWKPRSSSPKPQASSPERSEQPEWKPRGASTERPAWKPKGAGDRPAWKGRVDSRHSSPQGLNRAPGAAAAPGWKPSSPERREKPEWKPRDSSSPQALKPSSPDDQAKRKWIPKAEYKKLTGTEAKRDDKWRPGGEHKDPRQKYKDAKKAKWGRFKQAIRSRAKKKS